MGSSFGGDYIHDTLSRFKFIDNTKKMMFSQKKSNLISLKSIGWLLPMIDLNFIVHMVVSNIKIYQNFPTKKDISKFKKILK
jgi:hypothetical protein